MSAGPSIAIRGAPGSPYTRKMQAVLRYRRIAHRYVIKGSPEAEGLPEPKVDLLPALYLPRDDGTLEAAVDSTPLIRQLEGLFSGRAVVPPDPVMAFIDALIEDYADEWLTKPMFHYRWVYEADAAKAGDILPRWRNLSADDETARALGEAFASRQIGRLGVVGSNPTTRPIIEASYVRFLDILEGVLRERRFLLGGRPGSADFGVYGQLSQLAKFDPTAAAVTLSRAPRVYAWVDLAEDLSGLEPADSDWLNDPQALSPLLAEIGRTYAPVMLANAKALASGSAEVETEVDGARWVQAPFPYQGKCVQALRADFTALSGPNQTTVRALLDANGCGALVA